MRTTLATDRSDKRLNYDAARNWLTRHPEANPATAIALYDYQTPRVLVTQSWATNDISDTDAQTVCWREWSTRIWRAIFDEREWPSGEDGSTVFEVDAPGSRELPHRKPKKGRYLSDCCYCEEGDDEPTPAQLGL